MSHPHSPFASTEQRDAFRRVALDLAAVARPESLSRFRATTEILDKGGSIYDPVTEADREAERRMRERLAKFRPEDGINGEEFGVSEGASGWTWYLDPIDGTRAYVAGLPSWTTLIGLVSPDGDPVLGVIDQPYLDECYVGWTTGAELTARGQTTPLATSGETRLTNAILATTDYFIMTPAEQGAFEHLRATARLTRYGLDAYAYARLAAGTVDMVVETGLQPHDVAALIPVVRGAGGVALDWRGRPAKLGPQIACAASQELFDAGHISLRRSAG